MKNKYKRIAYLLDENVLLKGYKDKYGFHPLSKLECGFDCQKICKRDIGTKLFFSMKDFLLKSNNAALADCNVDLAGCNMVFAIDKGMYRTKIVYTIEDFTGFYETKTLVQDANIFDINKVITECLNAIGINKTYICNIKSGISSLFGTTTLENETVG